MQETGIWSLGWEDPLEEEMYEAARRANIHDYIMTLENGYDMMG